MIVYTLGWDKHAWHTVLIVVNEQLTGLRECIFRLQNVLKSWAEKEQEEQ